MPICFQLERFVSELGIARAEDPVLAEFYADLLPQRLLDIDVGEDAKSFRLQSVYCPRNSVVERDGQRSSTPSSGHCHSNALAWYTRAM